jgi:hypothetical protein
VPAPRPPTEESRTLGTADLDREIAAEQSYLSRLYAQLDTHRARARRYRRFRAEHILRAEQAYARFGLLALAVPAVLPPPLPFKIFVATAGALEYPRWRFLVTVMIARSLRYYVEGILAVYYGQRVLTFLRDNGLAMISIVAAVALFILLIYLLSGRGRAATLAGKVAKAEAKVGTTAAAEANTNKDGLDASAS